MYSCIIKLRDMMKQYTYTYSSDLQPVGVKLQCADGALVFPAGLSLRDTWVPPGCPPWERQHEVHRVTGPVTLVDDL